MLTLSYEREPVLGVVLGEVEAVAAAHRGAAVVLGVGGQRKPVASTSASTSRSRPSTVRTPAAVTRSIGSVTSSTLSRLKVRR